MILVCGLGLLAATGCGDDEPSCPTPEPIPETCVAAMDEAWIAEGQGADPTLYYDAFGLTFDNTNGYGLIGGEGNGDPGNWNIDGTNGTAVWGLWAGDHSISLPPSTNVSVDFCRGFHDGTIMIIASFEGTEVESKSVTLTGDFNTETVLFPGPIDRLEWSNACCFGLDNLRYTMTGDTCPPPYVPGASFRFELEVDGDWIYSKLR
jgi:hypothetical protein